MEEISGAEMDIDVGNIFNTNKSVDYGSIPDNEKRETITDAIDKMSIIEQEKKDNVLKIKDIGEQSGVTGNRMLSGFVDDKGDQIGHRHRSGGKREASPTGRRGYLSDIGLDKMFTNLFSNKNLSSKGRREVTVNARFISRKEGVNRLILIAQDDIKTGEIEIVSMGENGKVMPINVEIAMGLNTNCEAENGHIVIRDIKANTKVKIDFYINGGMNYALGVRAYGN